MRITIKDVAQKANLSVAATSMALNGKDGISATTRVRVLAIAKEMGYMPNPSAQSLARKTSREIGLVVPDITNPFYGDIVEKISKMTEELGYTMILGITNENSKREREYIHMFISRRVQGVIIAPAVQTNPDYSHIDELKDYGIPFVFCIDTYPGYTETCVMSDLRQGEYKLVRHLLEKGMRRIALVTTNSDLNFAKQRLEGYKQAFAEAQLRIDSDFIFNIVKHPNYYGAYEIADEVINREPEAICCINDIMAIGIIKRLKERGIKVPRDILVAGFDNTLFSEIAQPPITTVSQPLDRICKISLDSLINKITKTDEKDYIYLLPTELILRETTEG